MEKDVKRKKGSKSTKIKPIINLKDTLKFFNENLRKKTLILFTIFTVVSVIFFIPIIKELKEFVASNSELNISLGNLVKDKILLLLLTIIAGVVPHMYIAVLGGIGYIYQALIEYAYIIVDKGYFLGIIIILIPFVLNLVCISVVTAMGMYLCKINTNKFVLGQQRNMNFTRFRLELARATQNIEKQKKIQKKIDEKEAKLQSRETKIKYKEVFIIFGIICILQLISSLIEGLFI